MFSSEYSPDGTRHKILVCNVTWTLQSINNAHGQKRVNNSDNANGSGHIPYFIFFLSFNTKAGIKTTSNIAFHPEYRYVPRNLIFKGVCKS